MALCRNLLSTAAGFLFSASLVFASGRSIPDLQAAGFTLANIKISCHSNCSSGKLTVQVFQNNVDYWDANFELKGTTANGKPCIYPIATRSQNNRVAIGQFGEQPPFEACSGWHAEVTHVTTAAEHDKDVVQADESRPKNTRLYDRSCNDVWNAALPVLANSRLSPQSSDRASGVITLSTPIGSTYDAAANDAYTLTSAPKPRLIASYTVFRINSGSVTITPEGSGCRALLRFTYSGFISPLVNQWFALDSNNVLEERLLNQIGQQLANVHPPAGALAAITAQASPKEKGSVDVECSVENCEILVDGKFSGSAPSKLVLDTGTHNISVTAGSAKWDRVLELTAGSSVRLLAKPQ
jgi:hypothetical protein